MRVGDAWFTIRATRNAQIYTVSVASDAADYPLEIGIYLLADVTAQQATLNGEAVVWREESTPVGRCLVCMAMGNAELVVYTL